MRRGNAVAPPVIRWLVLLAVALLATGVAMGETPDAAVRFAADVEKTKAHLDVSRDLYARNRAARAGVHAAHPVHEIGNRLIGPARRVSAALGDRVRAALRRPGADVTANVAPERYARTLEEVSRVLDEAAAAVVTLDRLRTARFRARVAAALLEGVGEEYDEAVKGGRITQVVEYEDAYGFARRALVLAREASTRLRTRDERSAVALDDALAPIASNFATPEPPATPMTVTALRERIAVAVNVLGAVTD